MLTRGYRALLALVALSAPLGGCLITTTSSGTGGFGGGQTTSSTYTATGATNGTTVTGATVGTTVTGATGTSVSTGATNPNCNGDNGTGLPASRCHQMPNMPSTCPGTGVAPTAVSVCTKGFQIYRSGNWEELEACFEMIPAQTDDQCGSLASSDVGKCINTMYAHACDNADAVNQCTAIATSCAQGNDPNFNTEGCKADLITFSTAGINAYTNCINSSSNVPCAQLHSTCFAQVTSY